MRPCEVDIEGVITKATFHMWSEYASVVEPSAMRGGHPGGQIKYPVAIIEYSNGQVNTVPACCIKFTDTNHTKNLKIRKVSDKETVKRLQKAVKENDGYCPCELQKTPDTKCICKAFREQTEPGECHCGLYIKVEE